MAFSSEHFSLVRRLQANPFLAAFCLTAMLIITSCQTTHIQNKMNIEQARKVVMQMQSIPLQPPPRTIDDILTLLDESRSGSMDSYEAIAQRAGLLISEGLTSMDLAQAFKSRGDARYQLNRFQLSHEDYQKAVFYSEKTNRPDASLYHRLAVIDLHAGRYESALSLSQTAIGQLDHLGWRMGPYQAFQSLIYQKMGNRSQAKVLLGQAESSWGEIPAWARLSLESDGDILDLGTQNDIQAVKAEILESEGAYEEAHPLRSSILNYEIKIRKKKPLGQIYAQMALAKNLMGQGRLIFAEKEARMAVLKAVEISGNRSNITADALQTLGKVFLARGELAYASTLSAIQMDILENLDLPLAEEIIVKGNLFRAIILGAEDNFVQAMVAYDNALKGMKDNPYFLNRYAYRNPGLVFCMIKSGRFKEAEDLIRKSWNQIGFFERRDPHVEAELKALEALVLYGTGRFRQALEKFRSTVPDLIAVLQDANISFERRRRADALLQAYIDLLLELEVKDGIKLHPSIDVANDIFQIADIQVSQVNSAFGENISRAASLSNPELTELVRQEQDAKKTISALQTLLNNATAASHGIVDDKLVSLDRSIQSLVKARQTILSRIEQVFPKYTDFIRPKPTGIAEVQKLLASGEVYVGIWTLLEKTFVWVIPDQGETAFKVVNMSRYNIAEKVARLRQALAPNLRFLSDVPEFDLKAAYELYSKLLHPVAPAWQNAKDMIVVIRGPMDQIPIGVLPTEPVRLQNRSGGPLFKGYEDVPWLIRKVSISRIPSAAALRTLRTMQKRGTAGELFAGFGDPAFQPATAAEREKDPTNLANRGGNPRIIRLRGIRVVTADSLDNRDLPSAHLEDLSRLPDTADEIKEIARALGVDDRTNVFLGTEASEHKVKTENLSKKNILVFATHALLPGDLDGLTQPALAFSSPQVTLEKEDGLLTMGEILTLKLAAELVVLSACDTGAGHGFGNEAISGLGRAFFYSGARSMAVTMWPVETVSAKKLTTSMFHNWRKNPKLSWAEAMRRSMLQLMEGPGIEDEEGQEIARYAHPLFWAPFVVLGDVI